MDSFHDQNAVVTGSGSGIGRAIALGLASRGANLALIGRRQSVLETVATQAGSQPGVIRCYEADLSVDKDLESLTARLKSDLQEIGVLAHCAVVIALGHVRSASKADLDWQYRVNLRAPYILTQALLPGLQRGHGKVVFINSSAGLLARANVGQYAATKHGLKALADSLRDEVNSLDVRVLSLFLGRTASSMQEHLHHLMGVPYNPELLLQPEDIARMVINVLEVARAAEVTDISIRPMIAPVSGQKTRRNKRISTQQGETK